MNLLIQSSYFVAAVLFILGLKRMSSPGKARDGIVWAGGGMLLATVVTFFEPGLHNYKLMIAAIAAGSVLAWWWAKTVEMTDMPQMIAIYNGMGGGSAAAIAAVELVKAGGGSITLPLTVKALAVLGALIGTVAFSGSVIAFAKLQGLIRKTVRFGGQQMFNILVLVAAAGAGLYLLYDAAAPSWLLLVFFGLAFAFGIFMTLPIGGADMPVVISLYNALTGLAVGFEGFVLGNPAMMIAGIVVGASGTLLTQLMARAMNRPLTNVLFSQFGAAAEGTQLEVTGNLKPIEAPDAAIMMAYSDNVLVIPGYGMAVAQAQHKIWELTELLQERGVTVKFAIHPVAGRMPGHMNVLLAEAGVPYDLIYDLDEINNEFSNADVALVIGANDVVNPVARSDKTSPIYGMPILNADQAKNIIVIKRGQGAGFSGVENHLFYADNTRMLYGDGQKMAAALISGVKSLG
ncbi:MAG: NAD(P)(+) transhydrogenase (Re/Si-specific) subunit beta [Pseudomonadota bacterium]|nr:NAD(P)(+) transhydrogenase (Re/Si-specific) subunit beta [Pseudomonadota bacterium]